MADQAPATTDRTERSEGREDVAKQAPATAHRTERSEGRQRVAQETQR